MKLTSLRTRGLAIAARCMRLSFAVVVTICSYVQCSFDVFKGFTTKKRGLQLRVATAANEKLWPQRGRTAVDSQVRESVACIDAHYGS